MGDHWISSPRNAAWALPLPQRVNPLTYVLLFIGNTIVCSQGLPLPSKHPHSARGSLCVSPPLPEMGKHVLRREFWGWLCGRGSKEWDLQNALCEPGICEYSVIPPYWLKQKGKCPQLKNLG